MTIADAFVSKRNNFSLVRLAAAMAVVLSHAFYIGTGMDDAEPLLATTGLTLGQHAVNVFFGLSGFLILASWERQPDAIRFIAARMLRIMPGLAAAAVATAVAGLVLTALPLADYAHFHTLAAYALRVTFLFDAHATLPGVFEAGTPSNVVLMTIWTLKYEMIAYAGVLVLGMVSLKRRTGIILAILMVFTVLEAILAIMPASHRHAGFDHAVRFGFCFALGMAAWRFRTAVTLDGRLLFLAVALLLVAGFHGMVPRPLMYLSEIYAALWIALSPKLMVASALEKTDLSYGIYLYGWPVEQVIHLAFPEISALSLGLVSVAGAGCLAALSWEWIERPSLAALPMVTTFVRQLVTDVPLPAAQEAQQEQKDNGADRGYQKALPKAAEPIA